MNQKLLSIYLNDHLAAATAGVALANRTRGSNRGTEYGARLGDLANEIEADRATLADIMDRLGIGHDRLKAAAAWAAERAGRLKLNGSFFSYSPLSRLVELEALSIGVTGKRALWGSLARVAAHDVRLGGLGVDFDALAERAERQLEELEELRGWATDEALVKSS